MTSWLSSWVSVGAEISVTGEVLDISTVFTGAAGSFAVVSSLDAGSGSILPGMRDGRIFSAGGSVVSIETLIAPGGATGLAGFGSGVAAAG